MYTFGDGVGKGGGLHVCLCVFSLSDVLSSKNKEKKYLGLWYFFKYNAVFYC